MTKLFDGFNVSSFIVALLIILGIPACSGNDDTNPIVPCCDVTSLTYTWDYDCTSLEVVTISAILTDSNGSILASGSWSCSSHTGSIDNIPECSSYTIIVIARDSDGAGIFEGTKTDIKITAGQTTNIGTIPLDPVTIP